MAFEEPDFLWVRSWIATAEADEPGAGAVQAKLAERAFDVVVTGGVHR
jgi:hypothetical protein